MVRVWKGGSSTEASERKAADSLLKKVDDENGDDFQPTWSTQVLFLGGPVQVWNDNHFQRLREKHEVPDNFLDSSFDSLETLESRRLPNCSKGGSPLYMTADRCYIVKEISGSDHDMLLLHGKSLVDHALAGGSVMSPIYMHFEMTKAEPSSSSARPVSKMEKRYIAMRNLLASDGPWVARYDLKGCADDKTLERDGKRIEVIPKRVWQLHMWCSCNWTPARWVYYEGKVAARNIKLTLPQEIRDQLIESISRDCNWLAERGLMDYSLLIGIRAFPENSKVGKSYESQRQASNSHALKEFSYTRSNQGKKEVVVLSVGIIDFLQPWTLGKKIAMCIKAFEFNKATIPPDRYAARFTRHFAERICALPARLIVAPINGE